MVAKVSGVPESLNEALNIKLHSRALGPVHTVVMISHSATISFRQFIEQQQQQKILMIFYSL